MKNIRYCTACNENVETKIVKKSQSLCVKGRNITLEAKVCVCSHCGEEIIDEDLDNATLLQFYDEYRKLENLLTPDEIREIRKKYGLSQSSFSKILGFGEKTITRYERGAIQDVCHDNLIRVVKDVSAFKSIWNLRKSVLSSSENKKAYDAICSYEQRRINDTLLF